MIVVDVNLLLAAHLGSHPHHDRAHRWLTEALSTPGELIIPDLVWVGFLRIATNRRIFETPSTIAAATEFASAVVAAAAVPAFPGHPDGLVSFLKFCTEAGVSANLVPDAYLASIARALSCPVATFDRDFRRFDAVDVIVPD